MNKFIVLLLFTVAVPDGNTLRAADYEKWQLAVSRPDNDEYLIYRAAYRGLFTAYVWKDLADVAISSSAQPKRFNGRETCRLHMKLSTEDFAMMETFYPIRFHWRSTVNPNLNNVYLVEAIDNGKKQRHEFAWLDLEDHHIEVYRKRKKIPAKILTYDDEDEGETVKMIWEMDDGKKPPAFLDTRPPVDEDLSYFVHERTVAVSTSEPIVDPLAIIYSLRWQQPKPGDSLSFVVPYEDSFRRYEAAFVSKDPVQIGEKFHPATKIEIRRSKLDDTEDKGFLYVWYSDDHLRIPLQFHVEAKFGKIQLRLTEANISEYSGPGACIKRFPKSQTTVNSY